jgi:hypothetical protein
MTILEDIVVRRGVSDPGASAVGLGHLFLSVVIKDRHPLTTIRDTLGRFNASSRAFYVGTIIDRGSMK